MSLVKGIDMLRKEKLTTDRRRLDAGLVWMMSRSSCARSAEDLTLVARVVILMSRETRPSVEFLTTRETRETGILSSVAMSLLIAVVRFVKACEEALV